MNSVVKGVDVTGFSRSVDVSCTNTIGISSLEQMSKVFTCIVLYWNGPALSTTTHSDSEDTAGVRMHLCGFEMV